MSEENPREETVGDALASRPMKPGQIGESGGGPYPNQRDQNYPDAHDFKGGQSDQTYYNSDSEGDNSLPANDNAPSQELVSASFCVAVLSSR